MTANRHLPPIRLAPRAPLAIARAIEDTLGARMPGCHVTLLPSVGVSAAAAMSPFLSFLILRDGWIECFAKVLVIPELGRARRWDRVLVEEQEAFAWLTTEMHKAAEAQSVGEVTIQRETGGMRWPAELAQFVVSSDDVFDSVRTAGSQENSLEFSFVWRSWVYWPTLSAYSPAAGFVDACVARVFPKNALLSPVLAASWNKWFQESAIMVELDSHQWSYMRERTPLPQCMVLFASGPDIESLELETSRARAFVPGRSVTIYHDAERAQQRRFMLWLGSTWRLRYSLTAES